MNRWTGQPKTDTNRKEKSQKCSTGVQKLATFIYKTQSRGHDCYKQTFHHPKTNKTLWGNKLHFISLKWVDNVNGTTFLFLTIMSSASAVSISSSVEATSPRMFCWPFWPEPRSRRVISKYGQCDPAASQQQFVEVRSQSSLIHKVSSSL